MPGVLVTSSEFSVFEANMIPAARIATAFKRFTPVRNPVLGQWLGPAPRVTRKQVFGGYETDASWLYYWPDTPYSTQNAPTLKTNLHDQVKDGLAELSSAWSEPALIPYSPTLHGSLDWWQTGQAARTQTRDAPAMGLAQLTTPLENPVGPSTPDTRPQTVREAASSTIAAPFANLTKSPLTWVIVGAVVLVVAYPYLRPVLSRLGRAA